MRSKTHHACHANRGTLLRAAYTRGADLSGSFEGAGGIGGLLARSHGYSSGNWSTHNCYHADGNGNVTYLVDSSQALAASYRYDPFGNTISSSGTLSNANVYRFSSKEVHVNSGMYYYLYRFYDPNLQRWLNRDPIGEPGFEVLRFRLTSFLTNDPNSYLFVFNCPTDKMDPYGTSSRKYCDWILKQLTDQWQNEKDPDKKRDILRNIDRWLDERSKAVEREEFRNAVLKSIWDLLTLPLRIPVLIILPGQNPDYNGGGGGMTSLDHPHGSPLEFPAADRDAATENLESQSQAIPA